MKKFVEISMESLERLMDGRYVEGSLRIDECTGKLTFKAYQRKTRVRPKDKTILVLEHGWLKESKERIKLYESVPKALGTTRIINVMRRETQTAGDALFDRELDFVPFP
jgi:hypothetical protein